MAGAKIIRIMVDCIPRLTPRSYWLICQCSRSDEKKEKNEKRARGTIMLVSGAILMSCFGDRKRARGAQSEFTEASGAGLQRDAGWRYGDRRVTFRRLSTARFGEAGTANWARNGHAGRRDAFAAWAHSAAVNRHKGRRSPFTGRARPLTRSKRGVHDGPALGTHPDKGAVSGEATAFTPPAGYRVARPIPKYGGRMKNMFER